MRPLLLAAAVASVAVAAGLRPWERDTSREVGPGPTGTQAIQRFDREFAEATHKLALPPGVRWPARSIEPNAVFVAGRGGLPEGTAVSLLPWMLSSHGGGLAGPHV